MLQSNPFYPLETLQGFPVLTHFLQTELDLWHHYLIPLHLLSLVDWCPGVLPHAPSLRLTRGSSAPPFHIFISQTASELCHNAEKLIMFISASCWGPSVDEGVGGLGSNWAMFLETKPREQRQDKQTHWVAKTGLEIRIYKYPHVLFLLNIYTKTE